MRSARGTLSLLVGQIAMEDDLEEQVEVAGKVAISSVPMASVPMDHSGLPSCWSRARFSALAAYAASERFFRFGIYG